MFSQMKNVIWTMQSRFMTNQNQKILQYSFHPEEKDGTVLVEMQVSRWHQDDLLKNLTNKNNPVSFPQAKIVNLPHEKFKDIFTYTIQVTVPRDKVTALVETATKLEGDTFYQLTKEQLEQIAYKFPPSEKANVISAGKK